MRFPRRLGAGLVRPDRDSHRRPVGLNRSGTAQDPEPSLNVDVAHGSSSSCGIVFAETNNAVPWVTWVEKSGTKPAQVFSVRAIADTTPGAGGFRWQFVPSCTGTASRVFVRHRASDPQTGTWALDTPNGLVVDKTKGATGPRVRGFADGKIVLVWLEGDPAKEAAQVIACTNATLTELLQRVHGPASLFTSPAFC